MVICQYCGRVCKCDKEEEKMLENVNWNVDKFRVEGGLVEKTGVCKFCGKEFIG